MNTKYTITMSRNVFHDFKSRGLIDAWSEESDEIVICKQNKMTTTFSCTAQQLDWFTADIKDQIQTIEWNGDARGDCAGMYKQYKRALESIQKQKETGLVQY